MRTGGGIQNKVLESMALGTINIISKLAAIPIGGENGKDYIVEDNAKRIADIINDIFINKEKYSFLKENSKKYILENYTWSKYEEKYHKIIEELIL